MYVLYTYYIAWNSGMGDCFFLAFFTPATLRDRYLLVEDLHVIYNL